MTDRPAPLRATAAAAVRDRIASYDGQLRAVLDPIDDDVERTLAVTEPRSGPLGGMPFLVKGNIEVAGVPTTAGSAALAGIDPPSRTAPAVQRVLAAGAVPVGTANLSEWANFRTVRSASGWSTLGGQCRNPWDPSRSPGGSSAGSGVAVAAGYVPFALGTETDGSILCPAALNGVVGVKPTLGLVPTDGVIPISASQDVVGPIAVDVATAARVLEVIAGLAVPLSPEALRDRRIGVAREVLCGYDAGADAALEQALSVISGLGATIVDPADVVTAADLRDTPHEWDVLRCEFRDDVAAYLATRPGAPSDLGELIVWNVTHPVDGAPWGPDVFDSQDVFEAAWATGGRADPAYATALATGRRLARTEGIDATLARHDLDALVWPTYCRAWPIAGGDGEIAGAGSTPTAVAGYPGVTVPSGLAAGLPVGVLFAGPAGSDARLLSYAFAYERARPGIGVPPLTRSN